jgi:hypothetical protein
MTRKFLKVTMSFSLMLAGFGLARLHPVALAGQAGNQTGNDLGLPSYHDYALQAPYPATLDAKQLPDALSRNVYAMAAKIKPVLFEQPCFCYCDRVAGHKSLLDCFRSTHGSQCDVCEKEGVFAYQQTRKGKTPAQIRTAIIRGDWKSVDLRPYQSNSAPR